MNGVSICPCCGQPAFLPALSELIADHGLRPGEARVLEAVWNGYGTAVATSKMIDALYADDINGGPSPTNCYTGLNRALASIRDKLAGTGVDITEAAYGKGWRLTVK